jgi:hypothetical protein
MENIMKNLVKKSMVPAFAAAFCFLAAGQAQAVSVDVFEVTADNAAGIYGWFQSQGMGGDLSNLTILEDFEGQATGWYEELDSMGSPELGFFEATGEPGTGSTAYKGGPEARFEIRDYDANGRYNVYPFGDDGTNYLDSADITQLTLDLILDESDEGFNNIFFTISDPGDVGAITTSTGTTTLGIEGAGSITSGNQNGSLWFVGIAVDEEVEGYLSRVTWDVTNNDGTVHTNDGYGLDSIGTVNSVPEPATALLLGAGLLPLMGFLRRKKEDEV